MRIEQLLKYAGSLAEIARVTGVPYTTVASRSLRGNTIPAEWCNKLAREYGIPLAKLRPDLWRPGSKPL